MDAEFCSHALIDHNYRTTIQEQREQLARYSDTIQKLEAELDQQRHGYRPEVEALQKSHEEALAEKEEKHKEAFAAQQKVFDDQVQAVQAEKAAAESAKTNLEGEVATLKNTCSELRKNRAALVLDTEAQMFPKIREAWDLLYPDEEDQEEVERLIRRVEWVGSKKAAEAIGKTVAPYASDSDEEEDDYVEKEDAEELADI